MKKPLLMISMVLSLLACGGGAADDDATLQASAAPPLEAALGKAVGELPAQLPGDPETRSVGRLQNGGHVVAWVSDFDVYLQRYNKNGKSTGDALRLPIPHDLPDFMSRPAVVVQATGDVAVVYQRVRTPAELDPGNTFQQHIGVYLQRFAATGALRQGETEIVSTLRFTPGQRNEYRDLRALGLSDGSFVVSWGVRNGGCLGCEQIDLFMQRFDSAGTPVSGILVPVTNYFCANRYLNSTFEWDADDAGGFSVTGTIYPKQYDGDDPCGGYGPPVERQVYTYYPGSQAPAPSKQAKRKACIETASGLKGQERKARIDSCLAQ